jgi:hypothetical protein
MLEERVENISDFGFRISDLIANAMRVAQNQQSAIINQKSC